jgi:hypothetical protein
MKIKSYVMSASLGRQFHQRLGRTQEKVLSCGRRLRRPETGPGAPAPTVGPPHQGPQKTCKIHLNQRLYNGGV